MFVTAFKKSCLLTALFLINAIFPVISAASSSVETGCVKWQQALSSPVHQGVSFGSGNNVHVCTEDGTLYTLSENGELLWTYDAGSEIISPPSVGLHYRIFIGCKDGMFYAIDRDGNKEWSYATGGQIYAKPKETPVGIVYIASADGSLYAIGNEGEFLWEFTLPPVGQVNDAVMASPVIGIDGSVYVCGVYGSTLYAVDPLTGTERWSAPLDSSVGIFVPPVVAADGTILLIPSQGSELIALSHIDGTEIRRTDLADGDISWYPADYAEKYPDPKCMTEFVIGADGTVYVSLDDPYLRAVNSDGTIKWVTRLGMVGGFTLTVTDSGLIYAACDDGTLYVVDAAGNEVSRFQGNGFLSYPVVGSDGTIYLSDSGDVGLVWAINSQNCQPSEQQLHRVADISGDGIVNLEDLGMLALGWMGCSDPENADCINYNRVEISYFSGDIDRDLYVDFNDLMRIAGSWLDND